jgi:hypothetical protein
MYNRINKIHREVLLLKIWMAHGDDYGEQIVSQLMSDSKLKFYQGDFFCFDNYAVCAEWKFGIVFYDAINTIFYIVLDDKIVDEFDGDIDELQMMFRDDFNLFSEFHNELFNSDIQKWLEKVKLINEDNNKWLH